MKRIFSIFSICIILYMNTLIPYQQADAVVTEAALLLGSGATIGATALTIATGVGLLLIAAGVTYLVVTELNKAIDDYYNSRTDAQKEQIASSINADGTMTVPDSLWNDVKGYVSTKYNINNIPATVTGYKVFTIPTSGEIYPYTTIPSAYTVDVHNRELIKGSSITLQGHTYRIVQTYSGEANGTGWDKYKVQIDGVDCGIDNLSVIFTNVLNSVTTTFRTRNDMAFERTTNKNQVPYFYFVEQSNPNPNGYLELKFAWNEYNSGTSIVVKDVLQNTANKYAYQIAQGVSSTTSNTVSYSAQPQLTDTSWDWKNTTTGTRTVTLPQTYTDLVGKTATQVKANTVVPVFITPYSTSWTGTFSDCAPGTYTFSATGEGAIGVTNTGDWAGTWSIPTTGAKTWTGTYTGADGIARTVTATESLTIPTDTGTEFDYPELKVPADVLKNKFPFSIPWDLKNAVTSLVATPVAPRWVINFPSNVFVGGGQIVIDFTIFETWAKIIRYGELICFNIFLILATRKIIGA